MPKIANTLMAAVGTASMLVISVSPAHAGPNDWNQNRKCEQKDWDGRVIPTRVGDSHLGWTHFSRPHNIKKCKVVNGPLDGKPDKNDGHGRLAYYGSAIGDGKQVNIEVIVQYSRRTKDKEYDAGKGQKIGVITAFCKGQKNNKCPNWVNE